MATTVGYLQRLTSHGVAFRSFTEEHLSTENELVRNILLATLASLAKLEREKISQRTKAGLERARAKGKVLGRPKFSNVDRDKPRRSARNRRQLACREHEDADPLQHGEEARPSAGVPAEESTSDRNPTWLRQTPSRQSPQGFGISKQRAPLITTTRSHLGIFIGFAWGGSLWVPHSAQPRTVTLT